MGRNLVAFTALFSLATLTTFATTSFRASPAVAAASVDDLSPTALPMWNAFVQTLAQLHDYSDVCTAHEVSGDRVEDRTYDVVYAKPGMARSEIVAGAGRGSVAVWQGGDTVRGHVGGLLSGIKVTLGIDDRRAVDLRGKSITAGYFPYMVRDFEREGALAEAPASDGTTAVTLVPRDAAADHGLTREVLVLSNATHLPVEHLAYENGTLVERERYSDFMVDPPLAPNTFDL